jgi:hypothetical protein
MWKLIFGALVCGILISLASGLVENRTMLGISENKYYGYPLIWRVASLNGPTEYTLINLALNTAFWIGVSFLSFLILGKIMPLKLNISVNRRALFLFLILFIPLGLIMDFVHEFGHAMWGTAVGGRFTYMQIAYFEIYPRLAITPQFQLGLARVDGLTYDSFAYGLMLLGGSMTTNIASWLLAIILLKTSFGNKKQIVLKVLGLFGILDLPFYVLFPQVGLGHWIFFGGECGPEPLMGARMMGIPDPIFYLVVFLTTFGLILLYFKPLREKFTNKIRTLLERRPM